MSAAIAVWGAGAAVVVYVAHGMCRLAAYDARVHWKSAQKYPPDKEYYTYQFEKMDWDAHNGAERSDAFWKWITKACPQAPARPDAPEKTS